MTLLKFVEDALDEKKRTLGWLAGELDRTLEGLKLSLKNETIKYSDLKKMIRVLNMPIQAFFDGSVHQSISGNNNLQANHSMVAEPVAEYQVISLKEKIAFLEEQLKDKNEIIQLLRINKS